MGDVARVHRRAARLKGIFYSTFLGGRSALICLTSRSISCIEPSLAFSGASSTWWPRRPRSLHLSNVQRVRRATSSITPRRPHASNAPSRETAWCRPQWMHVKISPCERGTCPKRLGRGGVQGAMMKSDVRVACHAPNAARPSSKLVTSFGVRSESVIEPPVFRSVQYLPVSLAGGSP